MIAVLKFYLVAVIICTIAELLIGMLMGKTLTMFENKIAGDKLTENVSASDVIETIEEVADNIRIKYIITSSLLSPIVVWPIVAFEVWLLYKLFQD